MKIPVSPPSYEQLVTEIDVDTFLELASTTQALDNKGRYLHWDNAPTSNTTFRPK